MNTTIPLSVQQPDVLNALAQGTQIGMGINNARRQNALAQLYQDQGAGIMNGDPAALAQLAQFSPQEALGIQSDRLGMDATRQSMDLAQNEDRRADQRLRILTDQEARQVADHARGLAADQAAAEAQRMREGVAMAMAAQTPEQFAQLGLNVPGLTFENRDIFAARFMDMADVIDMTTGPTSQAQSAPGRIQADINSGLLPPDTPLYSEGGPSAAEAEIARIMEATGVSRAEAIRTMDLHETVIDPITRETYLIDRQTGERVIPAQGQSYNVLQRAAPSAPGLPSTVSVTDLPPVQGSPDAPRAGSSPDFTAAVGGYGLAANLANTLSDALGLGLVNADNEEATQFLTNLSNRTMVALSQSVPGRPSNFLLERFERLTTTPNSVWQGEGRTRERLTQTTQLLNEAIAFNETVVRGNFIPQQRAEAAANIEQLRPILEDYQGVLQSFRGQPRPETPANAPAQNRTSNGISWGVVN
ncbi:hypothetical protein [Wenxinia saemankumensis]|nr:hypothetical protein [Wenxinia saemankumensis]